MAKFSDLFAGELDGDLTAYDGDTLQSDSGESLRIEGINTPEKGFPGAQAALETAQQFETDSETVTDGERGHYGRTLGDRTSGGRLLSHELLSRGQAVTGSGASSQQRATERELQLKRVVGGASDQELADIDAQDRNNAVLMKGIREVQKQGRSGSGIRTEKNFHSDAFGRGVDQVQQMAFGLTKLFGDSVDSETITRWSQEGIDDQAIEMMFNPRQTKSFSESDGFSESIESIYESLIEQAPNIGLTVGTALLSGGIAGLAGRGAAGRAVASKLSAAELSETAALNLVMKQAAEKISAAGTAGFQTGAKIGAGSTAFTLNTGETKLEFDREGIDNNSKAAFVGLAKSALDFAGLSRIPGVNRLVGMGGRSAGLSAKESAKLFKDIPFDIAKSAVTEGSTEALQTVLDKAAVNSSLNRPWSEQDTAEVIEAGVIGAAAGGTLGGAGSTVQAVGDIQVEETPKTSSKEHAGGTAKETDNVEKAQTDSVAAGIKPGAFHARDTSELQVEDGEGAVLTTDDTHALQEVHVSADGQSGIVTFKDAETANEYVNYINNNPENVNDAVDQANARYIYGYENIKSKSELNTDTMEVVEANNGEEQVLVDDTNKESIQAQQKERFGNSENRTVEDALGDRVEEKIVATKEKIKLEKKLKADETELASLLNVSSNSEVTDSLMESILAGRKKLKVIQDARKKSLAIKRGKKKQREISAKKENVSAAKKAERKLQAPTGPDRQNKNDITDSERAEIGERDAEESSRKSLRKSKKAVFNKEKDAARQKELEKNSKGAQERHDARILKNEKEKETGREANKKEQKDSISDEKNTTFDSENLTEGQRIEEEGAFRHRNADVAVDEIIQEDVESMTPKQRKLLAEANKLLGESEVGPSRAKLETQQSKADAKAELEISRQNDIESGRTSTPDIVEVDPKFEVRHDVGRPTPSVAADSRVADVAAARIVSNPSALNVKHSIGNNANQAGAELHKVVNRKTKVAQKNGGSTGVVTLDKSDLDKVFSKLSGPLAPIYKRLFSNIGEGITVVVNKKGDLRGTFDAGTNTITVSGDQSSKTIGETVLHELVHSVSLYHGNLADLIVGFDGKKLSDVKNNPHKNVAPKDAKLAEDIAAIYNEFKKANVDNSVAKENYKSPSEFMAAALSNAEVAAAASKQKGAKGIAEFFVSIFRALGNYLGITKGSTLDQIFAAVGKASVRAQTTEVKSRKKETAKVAKQIRKGGDVNITLRHQLASKKISSAISQALHPRQLKDTAFKAKEAALDMISPFRTSLARLSRVAPVLAKRVANLPGTVSKRFGWHDLYQQQKAVMSNKFANITQKYKPDQLDVAYQEMITGDVKSNAGKEMQNFFVEMHKYIKGSSVPWMARLGDAAVGGVYFPQIHNVVSVINDQAGFKEFLLTGKKGKPFTYRTPSGKSELITESVADSIINGLLTRSDMDNAASPNASSLKTRVLTDTSYQKAAFENGWLHKDPTSVVEMYIEQTTRQKTFAEEFGAFVDTPMKQKAATLRQLGFKIRKSKNGVDSKIDVEKTFKQAVDQGRIQEINNTTFGVWSDGAQQEAMLEEISNTEGPAAKTEAELALKSINGMLGTQLNPKIRKSMQWAVVAQAYMLLAFSTLSSIPEFGVMMAGLAGKSPKAALAGLKLFVKDTVQAAGQIKKGAELKHDSFIMSRALGTIPDALSTVAFAESSSFELSGNRPRAAMEALFKYNGNILFANMNRAIATQIGIQYFMDKANAGDAKALQRWGVTPEDVKNWDKSGRGEFADTPVTTPGTAQKMSKVNTALLHFVDGHVARPTNTQKAIFMTDPRFMLISQLKSFFYSYGTVIVPEIARTMAESYRSARSSDRHAVAKYLMASMPLLITGLVAMPLAVLAQDLKATIRGTDDDRDKFLKQMSNTERGFDVFRDTGLLGPLDLILSFFEEEARGGSGIARALGPVFSHADVLFEKGPLSPEFVRRTTPILGTIDSRMWREWEREAKVKRRKENNRR